MAGEATNKGWISLYRSIQDHWLWQEKPYDKAHAWLDLLLSANHKEAKILMDNTLIKLEKGSFFTSELKLADRWGWSKKKVRNFLELLSNDNMIVKESTKKGTKITIVNYEVYQQRGNHEGTITEPLRNHEGTITEPLRNTNNNDNNDNKEEDSILLPETYELNSYFETITKRMGVISSQLPELNELVKMYPYDWIKEAMGIAVEKNARTVRYISKILQNWTVEGKTEKKKQEEPPNGWGHLKKFT
ncbi:DnaD domain protein [Clostridium thermarum]|uniref:DnaD domain protein n=1 Tax=Clostridium thermarum TaxID=1716543 RepID=UPI00111DE995|nr:DnaD domain protein [Clostridium thermarum]